MFSRADARGPLRPAGSGGVTRLRGQLLLGLLFSSSLFAGIAPTSTSTPTPTGTPTVTPTPTSNRVSDLELTMSASPEPVPSGQTLTYTLNVKNNGPSRSASTSVDDPLPPEVAYVSCSVQCPLCSGSTCSSGTAGFADLSPGNTATVTFTVTVVAMAGAVTNTAHASTSSFDPDLTNNTATVVSTIGTGPTVTPTPTRTFTLTPTENPTFTPTPSRTPLASFLSFYSLTPCRVVDTRSPAGPYGGPSLAAGADRTFVFAGQCNIPPTAFAVALNVVAVQTTDGPGFLTLFRGGAVQPLAATINYNVGNIRANNAIIPVGLLKDITVHCGQGTGTADMVIDVYGYFAP